MELDLKQLRIQFCNNRFKFFLILNSMFNAEMKVRIQKLEIKIIKILI